jgi:quercetin dioxygenase-like cupin family protein
MALTHIEAAETVSLAPLAERLSQTASHALFKSEQLELMRLVLLAGQSMPAHEVAGALTLQCIEGEVELTLTDGARQLRAGELLYLPGGVRHGLLARRDASLLLTLVLAAPGG